MWHFTASVHYIHLARICEFKSSSRLNFWSITNKYYDFEFMMFYYLKNSVMYIYCRDYTNSVSWNCVFRLISWSSITQCDDDFSFQSPPPTKIKVLKIPLWELRNNLITCNFLTRCKIIRTYKTMLFTSTFRHTFSAGSLFLCLPMRALQKQQHNLARKWVSGPSIVRLWF